MSYRKITSDIKHYLSEVAVHEITTHDTNHLNVMEDLESEITIIIFKMGGRTVFCTVILTSCNSTTIIQLRLNCSLDNNF